MKKFTLYLLITLLAVNAVGCGSEADTSVTAATTESAQSDTEPVDTTPVSLVEAKDFDGREYRVITSPNTGEAWALNEVYSEGANGDVLNDIIFERNRYLEEKFNISISVTNKSEYLPEVKTTVLANEDAYDLALAPLVTAFNWSSAGYLTEISEVPYLDVSASWWSQNALTNNSINHNNYFLM